MKNIKRHLLPVLFVVSLIFGLSCINSPSKKQDHSTIKEPVVQVKYTCSMHPEVVSEKSGECPKCGMELIKKE